MNRFPIPSLVKRPVQRGEAVIQQRSFRFGPREFFRLYSDEPLRLSVILRNHDTTRHRVALNTDIGATAPGEWRDYDFRTDDGVRYHLDIPVLACGLHRFRVKYSLDNGDHWHWDRVPHSYVLVDPASLRTVRLYTLIPNATGTIADWKALLPSIAAMGFDALHLLPVTRMGFSQSPYAAADLFSMDPRYLDPADPRDGLAQFEAFTEECRRLGLRLCLDLVLNHVGADSEMATLSPDWIVAEESEEDGLKRTGCWHRQDWIRWGDLVAVNYDHPNPHTRRLIWDYMKQYALFWSNYAAWTGGMVRFDNLHSSNPAFLAELGPAIRERFPEMIILGEYFTDQLTLEKTVPEWGINLVLANTWEHPFGPELRHYLEYLHTVSHKLRHIAPITTHDTGTPAQLFGADRSVVCRYAIMALFTTGQTGIVQGVEAGVQERIPFIGPLQRLALPAEPNYRIFIGTINALLAQHPVFQRGGNLVFVDGGHEAVLGAWRKPASPAESGFLLFANLDIYHPQSLSVDLASHDLGTPVTLTDMLSGQGFHMNEAMLTLTLDPCGVRIFRVDPA